MSNLPVTLNNCDQEPIHVPGAIQPHGVLFACREPDLVIEQASLSVSDYLGLRVDEVLGRAVTSLLTDETAAWVREAAEADRPQEHNPVRVRSRGGREFAAMLHRSESGVLVIELEPGDRPEAPLRPRFRRSVSRMHATRNLTELCQRAVDEVRTLTGFDRVMAYRFDPEWNGEVLAESRRDDLEPFLGLHYPAADIPAQARRLYTVNWLRFIVDVDYQASPIEPVLHPRTGRPLDLSFSVLRSVSPIHIEYLKNMGVCASMSISLLRDGQLWGLLACHHYAGPKLVPADVRESAEILAQALSWQISERERSEEIRHELDAQRIERQLFEAMTNLPDFIDGLASPVLPGMTESQGAAVLFDGAVRLIGQTPRVDEVAQIGRWLAQQGHLQDGVFATDRLPSLLPEGATWHGGFSGLLAVAISAKHGDFLLWFRPPSEHTVNWAGDPNKTLSVRDGDPRLSPRGSFALWKEVVRDRSLRWEKWQIDAASNVRRSILGGIRRRAAELREVNDRLMEADRLKDNFIATVSHELRTPLNAIHGWVKMLRSGRTDAERSAQALAVIERNTEAQAQLIEELLDVSRMVSGKMTLDLAPVDLVGLVSSALESLSVATTAQSLQIHSTLSPDASLVLGDSRRLQQVIWNLLTNAVKFTPKRGQIEISLRRVGSNVQLSVTDTGEGIPAEFLPHVFDLFRQADERLAREKKGLGLGLAIVRHIVELHGGRVSAHSEGTGKGASFTVRLPLAPTSRGELADASQSKAAPEPLRSASETSRQLDGVRVMVVEDELDSRELMEMLLSSVGMQVYSFGTADEALSNVPMLKPDLIVSDIGLPNHDGFWLIRQIRLLPGDRGGRTPAIAVSAHTRPKDRAESHLAGFQVHLAKPVDSDELFAVALGLVGRPPR